MAVRLHLTKFLTAWATSRLGLADARPKEKAVLPVVFRPLLSRLIRFGNRHSSADDSAPENAGV